ncbi:MAG: hypothetical protein HQ514_18090 [Rhodospirillales bacterium]|nr:hypothetical protein [Rhodospirillales bacterium]
MIIDLDNLDATLPLFERDIELVDIKPKPLPPRHAAFRGEVSRIVFAALRAARHGGTRVEYVQYPASASV